MTRVPLGARDAAWATACVLALLAQFAPADWRPALPDDTRSPAPEGQKALVLLAERAGYETVRRESPLAVVAGEETPADTLLVVLGPARELTGGEEDVLEEWVSDGGGLLFATREGRSLDLGPLGRVEGNGGEDVGRLEGAEPSLAAGLDSTGLKLFWPYGGTVEGAGEALVKAGANDEDRVALTQTWRGGTAVLAAGSAGFSNRSLAWGDNAALAFRLLERAANGRRRIVFDESLNLTGTPKTVALLLDPELRPLTLHLCLLALLWGWWRGRAFGPPLPDPDPPRRTLTDHTDAAGDLAWRTGDGAGVVGWYRRAVARDLRLPADAKERAKRAEALAVAAGRDPAAVRDLFARLAAVDARTQPGMKTAMKRRAAAGLIRELAALRADAGRRRR
ncbi:hypothetical protein CA12_16850 [Alienimonas californiensis]|uniref:DUF4350 domain-containing protein n=2 Tax=Alienimonas californiensis TaxID=2527989 RepID=A0A517P894_9PLAN|nr:hypothetical protein CA12_16850 [Alienimonas californiensis]